MNRQRNRSNILFWTIYLALLAVLLPHTAWAFAHFEPRDASWQGVSWGMVTAWAAAFAFEAAIAALTHKIAKHIDSTPRYTAGRVWLRRTSHQYRNAGSDQKASSLSTEVLNRDSQLSYRVIVWLEQFSLFFASRIS